MPKLDQTHIAERLQKRLADLKAGKEVAAREIRALLNDEQLVAMDMAWIEQQALRKMRRDKTNEELELGWKTKRELHIATYEKALIDAEALQISAWEKKQRNAEIRQARIYFESYGNAIDDGKSAATSKNIANNDLTKAGLNRLDGANVGRINRRDKEVNEKEATLRDKLKKN